METKIKLQKNIPAQPIPYFNYKSHNDHWGLSADYKGFRLEFLEKNRLVSKVGRKINNPELINIYSLLSLDAKKAWDDAYRICKKRQGKELGVEDIFLALLKAKSVILMLERLKVSPKEAEQVIKNYLKLAPPLCGMSVKKIPFEAFILSVKLHNHKVGTLMLLGALLKSTPHENILQAIFTNIGLTAAKLELFAVWFLNLNHEFPKDSTSEKMLYCMLQVENLENHFGYFFEFPAIEKAMQLSRGESLKDLEHKKALQLLVKAAGKAKIKKQKVITADLIKQTT